MDWKTWEEEEAKVYQPGTPVQLKRERGKIYLNVSRKPSP